MEIVSDGNVFELHPVSGEMDYGQLEPTTYQRLDEETLQAKVVIADLGLAIIYVCCEGDGPNGESGWRVSEVWPVKEQSLNKRGEWYSSIAEADDRAKRKAMVEAIKQGEENSIRQEIPLRPKDAKNAKDEGDDDYWALYDATPGPRSARPKPSPFTPATAGSRGGITSEAEYFERYSAFQSDVDSGGSSRSDERPPSGGSSRPTISQRPRLQTFRSKQQSQPRVLQDVPEDGHIDTDEMKLPAGTPVPDTATRGRFEDPSASLAVAEMAIKQHVSTSVKSLFRLCRNAGMETEEFNQLIRLELETLSLIERDE